MSATHNGSIKQIPGTKNHPVYTVGLTKHEISETIDALSTILGNEWARDNLMCCSERKALASVLQVLRWRLNGRE